MQTERFNQLRKKELEKVFSKDKMISVWRNIVRSQLRSVDIKDLYDCYDLNFNIEERVSTLRSTILKGTYKASSPLIYRLEKKYGICRHMVIPQPSDALILQVLTEAIADDVLAKQPSEKSFYSRAKHNVKKVDDITSYGVTLGQLWIELQKTIYQFSEEKELLVITDLSNYYDSISIDELRKVINNYTTGNEVVTDLLFGLLQDISWKPDYMPYSGRGIPTTGLEAVRLLAHAFLFEIDEIMKVKSSDSFARWMDDIVIGVNTGKEAKEVISATSDMLKSRGLALNMAKTKIIDKREALYDFQFVQNDFLTEKMKVAKQIKTGDPGYTLITNELAKSFEVHLADKKPKYWDKITKRYITCFSVLKSEKLLSKFTALYIDSPSLRTNLILYLTNVGFRKRTANVVLDVVRGLDVFDDISLYQVCALVTTWDIPPTKESQTFLDAFQKEITNISFSQAKPSHFYSVIWFMSKYINPKDLLAFITQYENIWRSEPFLRRQVTAVLSRVYMEDSDKVNKILDSLISSGDTSTVSLALQIKTFAEAQSVTRRLYPYLFPKNKHAVYPHSKFIVLCSVLNSELVLSKDIIQTKIKEHITDKFYQKHLMEQYKVIFD